MADRPARGTRAVDYVDVRNSKNINAGGITAVHSTAVFDNSMSSSFLAAIYWSGTAGTSWNTAANWVGNVVPASGDDVVIVAGTPFAPVLDVSPTINSLVYSIRGDAYFAWIGPQRSAARFTNNGTVVLIGYIRVKAGKQYGCRRYLKYVGDGSASTFTIKNFGANDYFDLTIDGVRQLLPWAAA